MNCLRFKLNNYATFCAENVGEKKLLLTILFAGLIYVCATAQMPVNKDSLQQLLSTAKDDTAKVQMYITLGNGYELDDPQTAAKYYLLALDLSQRLHYKKGIILSIFNYSGILNMQGTFDSSLILNKQSIRLAEEINNKLLLSESYANTGNVFQYLNEYDSATYYYETAKKYAEQLNNKNLIAQISNLMQITYRELDMNDKAIALGKEAVNILITTNDSGFLGGALSNLGNSYVRINPDSAMKYYGEALRIAQNIGYTSLEIDALLNIGNILWFKHDVDKMKPYYERALQLSRKIGIPESEAIADRGMAFYWQMKNNPEKARDYLNKALAITDSLGYKKEHVKSLQTMSNILFALHDVTGGQRYSDSAAIMQDSLSGDEIQKKVLTIEKKFETEKKEAQIQLQQAQLKQKNILNYFLIAGILALSIIFLQSYRNYKNRKKLQQAKMDELEKEKQFATTEALLKGEKQERQRISREMHDDLGSGLTSLLFLSRSVQGEERTLEKLKNTATELTKKMNEIIWTMNDEENTLDSLVAYIRAHVADRLEEAGIACSFAATEALPSILVSQEFRRNIYLTVKEAVHNIIKHAEATQVTVSIHAADNLQIVIQDNGKGIPEKNIRRFGNGLKNMRYRMEQIGGTFTLSSSGGTLAILSAPITV